MQNTVHEACQPWCLGLLFCKVRALRNSELLQKIRCTLALICYSVFMQASSIINDDFTATIQSDEFASEYEAWLDEQEKNYWREIEAAGN